MNAPMHCSRSGRMAAAVLAALLGLAATAEAQTLVPVNDSEKAVSTPRIARAEALEAQAEARLDKVNDAARTARLYLRAAELRPANDPVRLVNLRMAGRLYMLAGEYETARQRLLVAAEAALQFGDIVNAAHLFVDAAWVAAKMGDADAVTQYAGRAECLSNSPLITFADASVIRRRASVGAAPAFVVK
jgi:ATP/maltotriose-dependent transcriptional regulator MalT